MTTDPTRSYIDDVPESGAHSLNSGGKGERFAGSDFHMSKESFDAGFSMEDFRKLRDNADKAFDPDNHPIWKHYKDIKSTAGSLSEDDQMRAFSLALSMGNNGGASLDGSINLKDYKAAYTDIDAIVARANEIAADNQEYWLKAEKKKEQDKTQETPAPADSTIKAPAAASQVAPAAAGISDAALEAELKKLPAPVMKKSEKAGPEGTLETAKFGLAYQEDMKKYAGAVMDRQLELSHGKALNETEMQGMLQKLVPGLTLSPDQMKQLMGEYQTHVKTYQEKHPVNVTAASTGQGTGGQTAGTTSASTGGHSGGNSGGHTASRGTPCTMSAEAKKFSEICKGRIGDAALRDSYAAAADIRDEFKTFNEFKEAVHADKDCTAAKARAFEAYHGVMKGYTKDIKAEVEVNGTKMDTATLAGAVGIGNLNKARDEDKANDPKPIDGLKEVMDRAGVKMESGKEATISYTPVAGDGKAKTATLQDR